MLMRKIISEHAFVDLNHRLANTDAWDTSYAGDALISVLQMSLFTSEQRHKFHVQV